MANSPVDQRLQFDTELFVNAPFTSVPQLLGQLTNEPIHIMFKNQSTVNAFLADNPGSTKGTTMVPGETIIMDCRANSGKAVNMGWQIGTPFYVTATGGTGGFKVSLTYAS